MKTEPKIECRSEQLYVGKRIVMPMSEFSTTIPMFIAEIRRWLDNNNVQPAGSPLLRYHVIDMPEHMDVEVGISIGKNLVTAGQITSSSLPAGLYAVCRYEGVKNAVAANKKLIDWIKHEGDEIAKYPSERGNAFDARNETFLTDAQVESDQEKWTIEVAIKVR